VARERRSRKPFVALLDWDFDTVEAAEAYARELKNDPTARRLAAAVDVSQIEPRRSTCCH